MSDYTQIVDYSTKDALATGDPSKKILGSEIDAELAAIATAITSKADSANPTLTGTVTVPTAADTSDTTQAASTAFVRNMLPPGVIVPYGGSASPDTDVWLLCDGSAVSRTTYSALFTAISTTFGAGDGSTTFNVPDLRGRAAFGAGTGTLTEAVAAADVSTANETFTVASNSAKWITGMAAVLTTTSALPAGLSLATTYYVIRASATTIKFASSLANAQNGTAIDLTTQGTGTHTVTHTLTARTLGQQLGEEGHAMSSSELLAHTHTDAGHTHSYTGGTNGGAAWDVTTPSGGPGGNTSGSGTASISSTGGNAAMNIMPPSLVLNYLVKT